MDDRPVHRTKPLVAVRRPGASPPVISQPKRSTTAVLVRGPLSVLHLYARRGPGRLRHICAVTHAEVLHQALRSVGSPCRVILCGTRDLDEILWHVLDHADPYVIPTRWLTSVPREDPSARATLAARLVAAHCSQPIRRYCAADLLEALF